MVITITDRKAIGRAAKRKGKTGEREVAHLLKEYGFEGKRGQQFCGANGDADVVGLPGVHIEVKRVERLDRKAAMQQAKEDARDGEIPVVFHRTNGEDWCVIMNARDFMDMYVKGTRDE